MGKEKHLLMKNFSEQFNSLEDRHAAVMRLHGYLNNMKRYPNSFDGPSSKDIDKLLNSTEITDEEVANITEGWGWTIKDNGGDVKLRITGAIDSWFGVNPKAIIQELDRIGELKSVHMDIQSPGGLMQEGINLYSYLRGRAEEDDVDLSTAAKGMAASVGAVLYLSGDVRYAHDETVIMLHRPMGYLWAFGYEEDLDKTATGTRNAIQVMTRQLSNIIRARTGWDKNRIAEDLAEDGTWYDSEELDGLATEAIKKKTGKKSKKGETPDGKAPKDPEEALVKESLDVDDKKDPEEDGAPESATDESGTEGVPPSEDDSEAKNASVEFAGIMASVALRSHKRQDVANQKGA